MANSSIVFVIPVIGKLSQDETISITQNLSTLKHRHVEILHPKNFTPHAQEFNAGKNYITYRPIPSKHFTSIKSYNSLLLNPSFYKSYKQYNWLCIVQLDVFLLRDDFDQWIKEPFDYFGAPWFEDHGLQKSKVITGAGNGGFSLRRVQPIIKALRTRQSKTTTKEAISSILKSPLSPTTWYRMTILNSTHYRRLPQLNEDHWLAQEMPKYLPWYRVAPPEKAMKFSFDAQPSYLYELNNRELPTGIHAWWKYDPDFMKPIVHSFGHQWEPKSTS